MVLTLPAAGANLEKIGHRAQREGSCWQGPQINGDQQPSLMQRFAIQGYPHICHMREGQMRDYAGDRSLEDLRHFAEKGWRQTRPQPFYRAPNSPAGLVLGKLLTLPHKGVQLHQYLRNVKKIPDLVLLLGFLAIPVTMGMCCICLLDAWYSRRPSAWVTPAPQHAHAH
ncbi:hypothetical protein WJX84_010629 [Apatococcus fuscideae]|uniref:Uncharacterized protein n=1 Tax=Apatococcus fuscideae TaxID=2026836 RepID=A0AAW1TAT9_9CHLO